MDIDTKALDLKIKLFTLSVAIQAGGEIKEEKVKTEGGKTVTVYRGPGGLFSSPKGSAGGDTKAEEKKEETLGGANGFNISKEQDAQMTQLATGTLAQEGKNAVMEAIDDPKLKAEFKKTDPKDVEKAKGDNILEKASNYMKDALSNIKRNITEHQKEVYGAAFLIGAVVAVGALAPLATVAGGPITMVFAATELAMGNVGGAALVIGERKVFTSLLKKELDRKSSLSTSALAFAASFMVLPLYLALKKPIREVDKAIKAKVGELLKGKPAPEVTPEADKAMTESLSSPAAQQARTVALQQLAETEPEVAKEAEKIKMEEIPKTKGKNILEKIGNFVKNKTEEAGKFANEHEKEIKMAAAMTIGTVAATVLCGGILSAAVGATAFQGISSAGGMIMVGMGGVDIASGNVVGGLLSIMIGQGFNIANLSGALGRNTQIASLLGMAAVNGINGTINEAKKEEKMERQKAIQEKHLKEFEKRLEDKRETNETSKKELNRKSKENIDNLERRIEEKKAAEDAAKKS